MIATHTHTHTHTHIHTYIHTRSPPARRHPQQMCVYASRRLRPRRLACRHAGAGTRMALTLAGALPAARAIRAPSPPRLRSCCLSSTRLPPRDPMTRTLRLSLSMPLAAAISSSSAPIPARAPPLFPESFALPQLEAGGPPAPAPACDVSLPCLITGSPCRRAPRHSRCGRGPCLPR